MTNIHPKSALQGDYLLTTKVRNLKPKERGELVNLLNINDCWLQLACVIPPLFTSSHINILQNHFTPYYNSPADGFLDYWSTTGEKQPTLSDLLNLLEDAKLLRVAKYVSESILKIPRSSDDISQLTTKGFETLLDSLDSDDNFSRGVLTNLDSDVLTIKAQSPVAGQNENTSTPVLFPSPSTIDDSCGIFQYRYTDLASVTQNFDNKPVSQGGCKVGEGAFGTVYQGKGHHHWIAVKKLKGAIDKQFLTELEILTRYKHDNLLPLLGYSNDGPFACLVYAYMNNGSLQERLACLGNTDPLPWTTRITIARGTAQGINHLHTFGDVPLVHRDIKSANILLDENLVPKIGDFGLARIGSTNTTTTVAVTANVFGTSVYMANEAFRGDVSVKLDTFSYGVVLFELLTGLPPFDASREERDLISFMEENCSNIVDLLDSKAGSWNTNAAMILYDIAKSCVESSKKNRPTMTKVLEAIEELCNKLPVTVLNRI